ncbi:hypothetical protein BRC64_04015 [Halobacteriales archaeon QH_10_67_22]|nr:MAG: hypothetical protein BRC64_04015 [Halobacteriales archaeon QH_10_67_22]
MDCSRITLTVSRTLPATVDETVDAVLLDPELNVLEMDFDFTDLVDTFVRPTRPGSASRGHSDYCRSVPDRPHAIVRSYR